MHPLNVTLRKQAKPSLIQQRSTALKCNKRRPPESPAAQPREATSAFARPTNGPLSPANSVAGLSSPARRDLTHPARRRQGGPGTTRSQGCGTGLRRWDSPNEGMASSGRSRGCEDLAPPRRDRACSDLSRPCQGRNRTSHSTVATERPPVNFASTSSLQVGLTLQIRSGR